MSKESTQSHIPDGVLEQNIRKTQTLLDAAKISRSADKQTFQLSIWKAAAEAEYIAFRISATSGYENYEPSTADLGNKDPLELAAELLAEARRSLAQEPRHAYDCIRRIVAVLRRLYGVQEKAMKEAGPEIVDE